ncbi:MAG: hypothetical protein ACKOWF_10415 [Chloroflexota bacterium]
MEQARFAAIARALGSATTRRAGIAAALAALLGDGHAAAHSVARGGPSAGARTCKRDADCPTGVCDVAKGQCRCLGSGRACTSGKNCCAPLICIQGVCKQPCNQKTCPKGCCASRTRCVQYANQNPTRCGAAGAACKSCSDQNDCTSDTCVEGSCKRQKLTGVACGPNGAGCCDGGACTSASACSSQGICVTCAPGQFFDPGGCVCRCSANSCPDGCCLDGVSCLPYAAQSASVCGTGGAVCTGCDDGYPCTNDTCMQGQCSYPTAPEGTPCGAAQNCNANGQCV